jgi:hypothetical protein
MTYFIIFTDLVSSIFVFIHMMNFIYVINLMFHSNGKSLHIINFIHL